MLIENLFELVIIGLALTYSRFARLPVMVISSIILYSLISAAIKGTFNVYATPGYEIYYTIGGLYFLMVAIIFYLTGDKLYRIISVVLCFQVMASGSMLISDAFAPWHMFINDKAIVIECICVWLSTLRNQGFLNER